MRKSRLSGRILAVGLAGTVTSAPAVAQQQRQVQRPAAGATRAAPSNAQQQVREASTGGGGLNELSDEALIAELAARGQESLLDRAFDLNKVPQAQRAGIRAFGALRELTNRQKPVSAARRQALIDQVVAGVKTVLPSLKDPAKLQEYAGLLLTQVEGDVNVLEFWGENPATQARLRPVMEAVNAMLDKAAAEAEAQRAAVEKRMNNPNDRALADQWTKLEEAATTARFTRHMADYFLALSIHSGTAGGEQRAKVVDGAVQFLKEFDNEDTGVQAAVRNRIAKLLMTKGDYPGAKEAFKSVVEKKGLKPEPDAFQQYEARYFTAVCDLLGGNVDAARKALAELLKWQQANLPNTPDVRKGISAAAEMMQYRIHMAVAQAAKAAGNAADASKAEDAAVEVLMKLNAERPELRPIIYEQLVERLGATRDLKTLDPLMLQALVQKGIAERDKADADKADPQVLNRAIEAAQELTRRKGAKGVTDQNAETAELLVPTFLEKLGRKVEAARGYLDFIEKHPASAQREAAFNSAGSLIVTDLRRGPDKGNKDVVEVWTRFLPIAINPPFNRLALAFDYAERLRADKEYRKAADVYARVPADDPRFVAAKYLRMVSLYSLLQQATPGQGGAARYVVQGEQRKQLAAEVLAAADEAKKLATDALAKAKDETDKSRLQLRIAGTTLTTAEVAAGEQNDPQRTLSALAQFEQEVKGMPGAQEMLNRALFLRVKSLMGAGRYDDATRTLVALLEKTGGQQGQEIVFDLLSRLNSDFDRAESSGDTKTMQLLAQNRARLSGFLVEWAKNNPNPDIRKRVYSYSVYDAESKLLAGTLSHDEKTLRDAQESFRKLLSPEMTAQYRTEVAGVRGADPNYPHPNVLMGIGLAAFELGDFKTAQENLGRLVNDRKLGSPTIEKTDEKTQEPYYVDNERYWEAWYKLLKSNVELYKKKKDDPEAQAGFEMAKSGLKRLYVQGQAGGEKWRDEFEELRKEIVPDFDPKSLISPGLATQPAPPQRVPG